VEQDSNTLRRFFRRVQQGDRPSAGEWNRIIEILSRLTGGFNVHGEHYAKIRLGRTADFMGGSFSDSSYQVDRPVAFRHYDGEGAWANSDRDQVENGADPLDLVYDPDEYVFLWYSEQAKKWYPLNPRTVRHAVTCRDESNRYPSREDRPDTYPIKWVKLTYPEVAGRNGHTLENLNSDSGPDAFVHNIVDPDLEDAYIPVGTPIETYNVTRQWFTVFCCLAEDSSVSVSDSSYSSSSGSLSSASASSVSVSESSQSDSGSSFSSSLSSESGSDSSASSGGSSDSSSGDSSASSGGSSESSGGFECVNFVTSVTFDEELCELTVCSRQICFPRNLGITFGDESC
jgi:hypothetical protein